MSDGRPDRKCAVCGDKAAGYNFNVLSCVSCKAFFRRNALKTKELKCLFSEQCEINHITRRFCQKCRLARCFAIGMKKELILSEEDKQMRRNKVLQKKQNKSKEGKESNSPSSNEDINVDNSSQSLDIEFDDKFIADIMNDKSITEEEIRAQMSELEGTVSVGKSDSDVTTEALQTAAELEFAIIPIARPINGYDNTFTEMEGLRLQELCSAFKNLECPLGDYVYKPDNSMEAVCSVAENFEMIIDKLVKSSKMLTLFNEVCENDQLALIKYGAIQISVMRQTVGYDKTTNNLRVAGDQPNTTVVVSLDKLKGDYFHFLYAPTKEYYDKFGDEWENDDVILSLLTAIVLFNPDRPKLMHRDMVKYQQFIYMYLLKRYLQLRYQSECIAKTKFLRLLSTFKILNDIYDKHLLLYKEAKKIDNSSCEDSILNEIYQPD